MNPGATAGSGTPPGREEVPPVDLPPGVPTTPDDTLVPLLREHMVPWDVLQERYGPLLELVRTLLGVVPNCDQYLEIWEPAFRTYNIMVPNFFNLPFSIFGSGGHRRVSWA